MESVECGRSDGKHLGRTSAIHAESIDDVGCTFSPQNPATFAGVLTSQSPNEDTSDSHSTPHRVLCGFLF
jgi:hypothetical protein